MTKALLIVAAAGLFVVALFAAIPRVAPGPPALETRELRSYEVEPALAREVSAALTQAFKNNGQLPLGEVVLGPNGRIIVTATPSVQKGVQQVISSIPHRDLEPTPTVGFDLWIVTGTPGTAAGRPLPAELTPALESLRKSRTGMHFDLVEQLTTNARSGEDSEVSGASGGFRVESSVRKTPDGKSMVTALVKVFLSGRNGSAPPASLKSQVDLVPGELYVIGQSLAPTGAADTTNQEIYYILRARL